MLIRAGRILGIRNDSGHYRPTLDHLVNVLEALRMFGVPLDIISIDALVPRLGGGTEWCWAKGDEMLRVRGDCTRMARGMRDFRGGHRPIRPVGVQPR